MRGAWMWAQSDLRRRWPSLLVVALLIAFASGTTMALVAGAQRAGSATERFSTSSDLPELLAFVGQDPSDTSSAGREQTVAEFVRALADDPDVTRYQRGDTVVVTPDPVPPGSFGFAVVGQPESSPGLFGTPLILEGRYPAAADEMLVNERAAREYDLHVGDRRSLLALACMDCEFEKLDAEVTISGIVRLDVDLIDDPSTHGLFLVTSSFLDGKWTQYAQPGTIIEIHLADGADPMAVSQRLAPLITGGDISNSSVGLGVAERAGDLQRNALLVAAVTIGVLGVLVVAQAMSRHVSVRREDDEALLGLGLDRTERMTAVAYVLAPAVVVGALSAAPLAVALSPQLPLGLSRRADPDVGVHLDLLVVGVGVALTLVVGAIMAVIVARRWLHRRADVPAPPSSAIATLAGIGVRPVPLTGMRFALDRGPSSSRLPTRTTIAVGVMTVVIICAAVVMRSSLDALIHEPAKYGQDWEFRVGSFDNEPTALGEKLADDPRVESVDVVTQGGLNVTDDTGRAVQVPTIGMRGIGRAPALGILAGSAPNGANEIALGSQTMADLDARVGDTVTVDASCGQRTMVVVGRTIVPLIGGDNPDVGSVIDLGSFDDLCADQLVALIDTNDGALVRLRDGVDVDEYAGELADQGLYSEAGSRPSAVTSLNDIADAPMLVAAIVALLGAVAIGYAMLLTVRRRRQDLAVLRAIGFSPSQTGWVMTWQAMVVAMLSIVIGVPLGIGAGRALWSSIAGRANMVVQPEMPPVALVGVCVGALIVALMVSAWPNHRARHLQPARVLRGE